MIKLMKYLKKSAGYIILIIALLFLQAYCDLSLPDYTSKIVNVGIQQSGIEDSVPEKIRKTSMDSLQLFMDDDDKETVDSFYEEDGDDLVLKDDITSDERDELNSIFGKPMMIVASLSSGSEEVTAMLSQMGVPEGTDPMQAIAMMPEEALDAMTEKFSEKIGELYTGDTVEVTDTSDSTYWYVYSAKLNKSGYVNRNYLVGGGSSTGGSNYTVSVSKGYLALRTAKAYDDKNEIGELYSGDTVQVQDTSDSTYWYVYSPKLNKSGYVNRNYLVGGGTANTGGASYTVSVSKGYLALRTAKAYDDKNEIGELYSGDTVQVQDSSDSTYWYVYSPKLNKSGYVNRNYLVGAGSSTPSVVTKTVSVSKGYLALRTAKAYDDSNEIGELYSGDTVQVQDTSDSTYWYVYAPKLNKSGYVNKNYLY